MNKLNFSQEVVYRKPFLQLHFFERNQKMEVCLFPKNVSITFFIERYDCTIFFTGVSVFFELYGFFFVRAPCGKPMFRPFGNHFLKHASVI